MKVTKTYSVDKGAYKLFDRLCKKNNINKSSFIEDAIKKYLIDNLGYDDPGDMYQLKTDPDKVVAIEGGDDTFFNLSDGSKIPQILFYQIYEEMEQMNSDEFFQQGLVSLKEKMMEKARLFVKDATDKKLDHPIIVEIKRMFDEYNKLKDINDVNNLKKKGDLMKEISKKINDYRFYQLKERKS